MRALVVATFLLLGGISFNPSSQDDWLMHARISTPYGYNLSWKEGVERAVKNGANVLLDWAPFSDTYDGRIINFTSFLQNFSHRASYIHSHYPGIKYMVYFAPFELQTLNSDMDGDGKDDDGMKSTYTDHPEWLQVGIDGRKAVFYGNMPGMPFWVEETSEDVWLSPSNREYRQIILNEARQIAAAGADAIWFDVPHLCYDFGEGWQEQWSTVDNASRADFENDTGFFLPPPPITPDWENETWLKFVEWRYKQVIDFIKDFNKAIKEENPKCKLVIETSSEGLFITQHACDIYSLPDVCDVIAHEYGGPYYEVQYYKWMEMVSCLRQWYDFDYSRNHASWLLSYVEQGNKNLAEFHACVISMAGFNYYTSGGKGMADVVDEGFMKNFFSWMERNDEYFYGWKNFADVGVIFSRHTLDYLDRGKWDSYAYHDEFYGNLMMLVESNIPFKVLDSRKIASIYDFDVILLPDFACMNESQAEKIREYVRNGGKIIAINDTSLYTLYGERRENFLLSDVLGVDFGDVEEEKIYVNEYGEGKVVYIKEPLGRYFYWAAQPWSNYSDHKEAENVREEFLHLFEEIGYEKAFGVEGNVIVIPYEKNNVNMLRIINFRGIRYGNAVPEEENVVIRIKGNVVNASLLPFMGKMKKLKVEKDGNFSIISFEIGKGGILLYKHGNKTYVKIERPEGGIYVMDRHIISLPTEKAFIIGAITVEAQSNADMVKFYIDDEMKYVDTMPPYSWKWDERVAGMHTIRVLAENESDEMDVWIFNKGI